jgi:anti-anti-sigma factor
MPMVDGSNDDVVIVIGSFEGSAVDAWGRAIAEAVALQSPRLVIDLRHCPVVDAAGIAVLLQAHRAMMHAGGRMVLRTPTDRVRRTLRLAGLVQVFEIEQSDGVGTETA